MTQHIIKRDPLDKAGATRSNRLTTPVKNNMLLLHGQMLRPATKNGHHSKTPGLHLSATHVKKEVGQFTASTPEATNLMHLKESCEGLKKEEKNRSVWFPLKLAPLELPQDIREAQTLKLQFVQEEIIPQAQIEVKTNKFSSRTSSERHKLDPFKGSQQKNRASMFQPAHLDTDLAGDRGLKDMVCHGTRAQILNKPTPCVHASSPKYLDDFRPLQLEPMSRRVLLRRTQCIEDDEFI
ncbi:uncharacterized protein LOC128757911 [Synchiropus splendidus]|uniref:uncharacterized protein LOC128757911 n=1 Tax=Synchiropus splendidus TaxID=270530 RepID=UPI00237E6062|nr:uncharacterized protein LOC128757911 [Synchiropus splendidus]